MNVFSINWFRFLKYNYLTKEIVRKKRKYIIPYWGSKIITKHGCVLDLKSNFHLGLSNVQSKRRHTIIHLKEGSKFICNDYLSISMGTLIFVEQNALLETNGGCVNTDSFIRVKRRVSIGSGVQISRDVIIRDDDGHSIIRNGYIESKPINIGNNVWLCERSCVLKGATIGDSVVVGYGTIVTGCIPNNKIAVNKLNIATIDIDGWKR